MHPDRVEVRQNADMSLAYSYTAQDGTKIPLAAADVLHLRGLSLDGITRRSACCAMPARRSACP
jgi:phage portal protein BeeE